MSSVSKGLRRNDIFHFVFFSYFNQFFYSFFMSAALNYDLAKKKLEERTEARIVMYIHIHIVYCQK